MEKENASQQASSLKEISEKARRKSTESIEDIEDTIKKESQTLLKRILNSRTKQCKHKGGCIDNVVKGAVKSFMLGFATKYSINLLAGLMRPKTLLNALFSAKSILDSGRFILFVIIFNISYKIVLCTLRRIIKNEKFNSIVAGTVSASTLAMDTFNRRMMISLLFFSRSLETFYNWCGPSYKIYLGETIFFMVQCVFMKYLYAYEWELVPKSVAKIYKAYSLQKKNDLLIKEKIWRVMLDSKFKR
uniref:Uncharacterized protein n=1 Tax=Euplotes crassus TaxID=5936 RepID=A0A7S3NTZ2_EUPCR